MRQYHVRFTEPHAARFDQTFDCHAEGADHAREQCLDAYPTATVHVITDVDLMRRPVRLPTRLIQGKLTPWTLAFFGDAGTGNGAIDSTLARALDVEDAPGIAGAEGEYHHATGFADGIEAVLLALHCAGHLPPDLALRDAVDTALEGLSNATV